MVVKTRSPATRPLPSTPIFPVDERRLHLLLAGSSDILLAAPVELASADPEALVVEHVAHDPLALPTSSPVRLAHVARTMRAVHDLDASRLATWCAWDGAAAWDGGLRRWIAAIADGLEGALPGRLVREARRWIATAAPLDLQVPSLVHGDINCSNVLIGLSGDRVVALVDWEWATVGDPLLDLVKIDLEARADAPGRILPPARWNDFLAAYAEPPPACTIDRYRLYALVQVLPYLLATLTRGPLEQRDVATKAAEALLDVAATGGW